MTLTPKEKEKSLRCFEKILFDGYQFYNLWKALYYSRFIDVVGKESANKNVEIHNTYGQLIPTIERTVLISYVVTILQLFDGTKNTLKLSSINKDKYNKFVKCEYNKKIIDSLQEIRNNVFAHRHKGVLDRKSNYKLPSLDSTNSFFERLIKFHNELAAEFNAQVDFINVETIVDDLERLFQDIVFASHSEKYLTKEIILSLRSILK